MICVEVVVTAVDQRENSPAMMRNTASAGAFSSQTIAFCEKRMINERANRSLMKLKEKQLAADGRSMIEDIVLFSCILRGCLRVMRK